jgi:iron complex outermembrane receptor protein
VPVAVSVVQTEALTKANAGDITDLNNLGPSVNLNATINGRVPLGVRGISSNANEGTVGLASGVAIMIDGVPVPSDAYTGNQLDDVEKVEVLKGPQATLGGRTASAGVINLVTRGPSKSFEGSVSATATTDHEYRGSLFFAGPLSDSVQGSVSAYGNTRDYPITTIASDQKTDQKTSGIRAKLRIDVSNDFDITLMAHYAKQKSDGFNFVYTYLTPGAYMFFGTSAPPLPHFVTNTVSATTLMQGVTPSWTNLSYNSPAITGSDVKDTDGAVTLEYRLPGLTLSSTTSYLHETQTNVQDLFAVATFFNNNLVTGFHNFFNSIGVNPYPPGSPATWAPFNNTHTQQEDVKQLTEELKVASSTESPVSCVAGFFYSDTKVGMNLTRTLTRLRWTISLSRTRRPTHCTVGSPGRSRRARR